MISKKAQNLQPYVAGLQPKGEGWIKLNTNENPYPPSPKIVLPPLDRLRLYPDGDSRQLCGAIAEKFGVRTDNVFCGNGSDEVLAIVFQAFLSGYELSQPDVSYGFYPVWSNMYDCVPRYIPVKDDFSIGVGDYKNRCVIIANPNAPTSLVLSFEEVETMVKNNKFVVVDEAYLDFADVESAAELVKKYENLVVVRTFSKSYSLAGLRVGYAIGNAKIIEIMNRVKNSFNSYPLDMISQKVALDAFLDNDYHVQNCKRIIKTREDTIKKLRQIGLKVLDSQTNFLFIEGNLYNELYENKILVRRWDRPRIDKFIRVTVGTDNEMEVFVKCIEKLTKLK
ncbi:MAG: histidinol-phosphate transaminase [Puniceicoccales bacterium]|nr:histidinol-phosphate transaminase [Puniceicoccales bacterium]